MMKTTLAFAVAAFSLFCTAAWATPSLRAEVTVTAAIVTVGDMFDDAGALSEMALFRAPVPGTTGIVPLADVTRAAGLIGLTEFENVGITRVRVARAATVVDVPMLNAIIDADLANRGILGTGVTAAIHYDTPDLSFSAEAVDKPVTLINLRYTPGNGGFTARLQLAGIDRPVDISGQISMQVMAPQLVSSRPAGTVLQASDLALRPIDQKYADAFGFATMDQLLGKQLLRQSQSGMLLKPSDVAEPTVITRNSSVTVYLHSGAMTLTVKGQALGNAAAGQDVSVMNATTKKILHGTALANGSVLITSTTLNVAGL